MVQKPSCNVAMELSAVAQKKTKNPMLGDESKEGAFYLPMLYFDKPDAKINLETNIFKNQFPTDCPISSCSLLKSGCEKTYTGTNLELSSKNELTAKENKADGYQVNLCFKCIGPK